MAPRDYKKRGPATKKNTPPAPEKPALGIKVILVGVIGLIGLLAMAYGLYAINGSAEDTPASTPAPIEKKAEPLPEKPKEKWSYIKDLPEKEVEVEVPEREKSDKLYQMQCASFRSNNPAETMKAKIAFMGIESQIKVTEGKNGKWYRVVLGPYQTKRDAERDRHRLQNNRINGCKIWLWNWK
ncbi:SPOR domain-containing protein [Catenovulum sp. SM1970]|uniref:SPOR domain-containing protein n=1 Tax=Marinifaba aquimaris TaxID=2741323 RepID=UPI001572A120|nr:SPOR domain-containing protein [Marinifaba aquimaris]NTS76554.1 SPOR domain-containing protein [Marinifaba aquimaris]